MIRWRSWVHLTTRIKYLDTRTAARVVGQFEMVGERSLEAARDFMADVASRVALRPQITTDANTSYREAIEAAFGSEVDYGQLLKDYGLMDSQDASPPRAATNPDPDHISTSHVERQNLTMRMGMRRFTRLTNGFSKKVENLAAAVALHFMHYNFARPHQSLGKNTTPAMAAGISDHVWTCEEIAALLD
jgi:hypothetical protein